MVIKGGDEKEGNRGAIRSGSLSAGKKEGVFIACRMWIVASPRVGRTCR